MFMCFFMFLDFFSGPLNCRDTLHVMYFVLVDSDRDRQYIMQMLLMLPAKDRLHSGLQEFGVVRSSVYSLDSRALAKQ